MYTEECINIFLENQGQLFPQPVAASYEEAETFLEDCMAAVVDSLGEVREYLDPFRNISRQNANHNMYKTKNKCRNQMSKFRVYLIYPPKYYTSKYHFF